MSIEISSSSTPPAILSAGSVMPKSFSSGSPNTAKNSRIPVAISVPRNAIVRRSSVVFRSVSAANTSTRSAGPMVAKKVVSAKRKTSSDMSRHCPTLTRKARAANAPQSPATTRYRSRRQPMSFALTFDPPAPRPMPWGAFASVALHAGLAAIFLFVSPLKQLVIPPPEPVAVEIVTEAEFAALQSPSAPQEPTPAPILSAPAAEAAPAAPTEDRLPALPAAPARSAREPHHHGQRALRRQSAEDPSHGAGPARPATLAISERVVQLCNIEGLEQIRRAASQYAPDTLVPFAMADPMAAGLTLRANGAAFRSRGRWYGVTFSCTAGPDLESVTAFEFKLGDPIPEDLWEDHNLNAADADE